jgi:peptide/nickel transport system permease protein
MSAVAPVVGVHRVSWTAPVRELLRRPLACGALVYLVCLVAACSAAPLVAPANPNYENLLDVSSGPSLAHLLGTDDLGRDVLSRILFGGRITLLDAAEAVIVFVVVGVPLGLVAGYLGGRLDRLVMSVTDIVLSIPVIIVLLVVAAVFQGDLPLMVSLGIVASPSIIRVVRATTLSVRTELYVKAAEVIGLSRLQVLRRHILPQVLAPAPSWGSMIAEAATVIDQQPWLMIPSGCVIALTVIALGLVGDAVRDININRRSPTVLRARSIGSGSSQNGARAAEGTPNPEGSVPSGAEALLSVRDLSIVLPNAGGELLIVDAASFDIGRGESLGIVGESGCGKTITARALLGLLPPGGRIAGGSAMFDGEQLVGARKQSRVQLRGKAIGLISQEPMAALDPAFTVGYQLREVIRANRKLGRRAARTESLDLLEQVRLPNPVLVAGRYPHQLSGGMAQRACIALALAGRPKLLIADEPTTALDVTVQAEILDLLTSLRHDTGMAILFVTHDWGVVADFCERTAVMYAGQVVEIGGVDEMFRLPLHPYTEGLLAANPHFAGEGPLPSIPGTVPPPGAWPSGCRFAPRCPYVTVDCKISAIALRPGTEGRVTRCLHPERIGGRTTDVSS